MMKLSTRLFGLLLVSSVLITGVVYGAEWKTLPGHVPSVVSKLSVTGRLAATNQMRLAIGLPLRDPAHQTAHSRGGPRRCGGAHDRPSGSGRRARNDRRNRAGAGTFKTLVAAVKAADLADTLSGKGPFTVFAPTDDAFAALPPGTLDSLLKPENKQQLRAILLYHVVPGIVKSTDLKDGETFETAAGQTLTIHISGGSVQVNDATVIKADILASNGIIHVINKVLLPK